ncbi:carboxymuconolactone decarboxylase family protein [Streptomyces sp. NPDC059455]|uniref:carboxymuconolactone decarboxylase family protein n=1 Tax=Streptomyces sp. NPDC059455 TaxID=3346837 RepID=UPI0036C6E9F9
MTSRHRPSRRIWGERSTTTRPSARRFKGLAAGVHAESHLDARLRELTILRLSAELGSDVEWGQHFKIATTAEVHGRVCLTVAEARAVRDGEPEGFPARGRAVMEYAAAFEKNPVDDEVWERVSAQLTRVEILDLTVLAGLYGMAGRLTNALAVPMDEGILPISAVDSLT